jgi:hypothetical protein
LACVLQRALVEAEELLEQQRHELAAGFLLQSQKVESQLKQQLAEAQQAADLAAAAASRKEEALAAARAREIEALAKAEVGSIS